MNKTCEDCIHFFVCGIQRTGCNEAENCIDYLEPASAFLGIGTEVWYIADQVRSAKITSIIIDASNTVTYGTDKFHFTGEDIGTDVFLQYEEAAAQM